MIYSYQVVFVSQCYSIFTTIIFKHLSAHSCFSTRQTPSLYRLRRISLSDQCLRDNGGFLPLGQLGQLAQLERDLDQGLQSLGGRPGVLLRVVAVLFNVHSDGGALRSGTGQSEDDSTAVGKLDVQTLVLGDGTVDRVRVREVVGFLDGEADVG